MDTADNGDDCDDLSAAVNPGATEVCNGIDDDCVGGADDGLTFVSYYLDSDNDTYGDAANPVSTCDGAPTGYVADSTDCDDAVTAVNPGATETCNGIDDDCLNGADDGLTFVSYYLDSDNDTYGDAAIRCPPATARPRATSPTTPTVTTRPSG
ncbi:MAG: putative metal-binding motif-containing protein [Alphaproteobacteria bacterium]|nr:putative metal-binding motif-containing protein [Alphaproteobacteria bacterium]